MLVTGTLTITGAGDDDNTKRLDERYKGAIFKNCASFTDCLREINNTQIDTGKDFDVVMPMYNVIEYINSYSKTSGSLWQYDTIESNNNKVKSESFKLI